MSTAARNQKKTVLQRVLAGALSGAALVSSLAMSVPSAHAEAQGCTGSNYYNTPVLLCTTVNGEKENVKNITASFDVANPYECNGDFKVWGTYANGDKYVDYGKAKCGVGRVWVNFNPKKTKFKDGTKICSAIMQSGKPRDEHACIEIKK